VLGFFAHGIPPSVIFEYFTANLTCLRGIGKLKIWIKLTWMYLLNGYWED